MKKLMTVVVSALSAAGINFAAVARTVAIDSVEKNGDGLETAFNLTIGAGTDGISDTLYRRADGRLCGVWQTASRGRGIPEKLKGLADDWIVLQLPDFVSNL